MRTYMYATIALVLMGCNANPMPKTTTDSTVVGFNTINMGRSMSINVDACLQSSDGYPIDAIALAINTWRAYGLIVYTDKPSNAYITCNDNQGDNVAATTYARSHIDVHVSLFNTLDPHEQAHTIMHEFGHLEGADHVGSPNSIMYPVMNDSLAVTDDDINAIEEQSWYNEGS